MADLRTQETPTEEKKTEITKPYKPEILPKLEDIGSFTRVKAPTFDGKMSWTNYAKHFEAAARVNNWIDKEKA